MKIAALIPLRDVLTTDKFRCFCRHRNSTRSPACSSRAWASNRNRRRCSSCTRTGSIRRRLDTAGRCCCMRYRVMRDAQYEKRGGQLGPPRPRIHNAIPYRFLWESTTHSCSFDFRTFLCTCSSSIGCSQCTKRPAEGMMCSPDRCWVCTRLHSNRPPDHKQRACSRSRFPDRNCPRCKGRRHRN